MPNLVVAIIPTIISVVIEIGVVVVAIAAMQGVATATITMVVVEDNSISSIKLPGKTFNHIRQMRLSGIQIRLLRFIRP